MTILGEWARQGGEVAVAGLGRSGQAAVRLLSANGLAVYGSDLNEVPGAILKELAGPRVTLESGHHDLARVAGATALVVSPGIPPTAPVLGAARRANIPVYAEVALGLAALGDISWIAVTGTNGKSTVTALIDQLLRHAGRSSVAAGNIGLPLSEVALRPARPEWPVVELSSFQLHDMPIVRPRVGVLTNLSPDHLDRYPDVASYYSDKRRLFQDATAESIWIHNLDDPASRQMVSDVPGRHFSFSTAVRADAWFDRDSAALRIGEELLVLRSEFALPGDHNVANLLAAALAVNLSGVPLAQIATGVAGLTGLAHRLEPVGEVNGVRWVNDSKATNIGATRVALEAMDRPYVLLLGGRHKGEPYTALAHLLGQARAIVAYGEAAPLVLADLSGVTHLELAGDFADVIGRAEKLAQPGDTVLLSPACSSYDMFDNYEQRGARFRELVAALA